MVKSKKTEEESSIQEKEPKTESELPAREIKKEKEKRVIEDIEAASDKTKAEEPKSPKLRLSPLLVLGLAFLCAFLILGAVMILPESPGKQATPSANVTDSQIIDIAFSAAERAISGIEQNLGFDVETSQAQITSRNPYIVSFPVRGSEEYSRFQVNLDSMFNVRSMGFDDNLIDPKLFASTVSVSRADLRHCGEQFNVNETIMNIIQKWYQSPSLLPGKANRIQLSLSRYIQCNGLKFPYGLELGDGFVETSLIYNVTVRTEFKKGVVIKGVKIPREDIAKGVELLVTKRSSGNQMQVGPLEFEYRLSKKTAGSRPASS